MIAQGLSETILIDNRGSSAREIEATILCEIISLQIGFDARYVVLVSYWRK
jgi:hypothetical protein